MDESIERPEDLAKRTFKVLLGSIRWRNTCVGIKNTRNTKLSHKKLFILMLIYAGRAKTVSDLEEIFSSSSSSLSILLSKMVDEGYLTKELPGKGEDGRKIYFKMLDKGQSAIMEAYEEIAVNINSFYDSLNDSQKHHYVHAIDSLSKVFELEEEEW